MTINYTVIHAKEQGRQRFSSTYAQIITKWTCADSIKFIDNNNKL